MNRSLLNVPSMISLLGRTLEDESVLEILQDHQLTAVADRAYLELKRDGISIMFKEESEEDEDEPPLYLYAFHLHRKKHDGYAEYCGELPSGVRFDDSEADVVRKLGPPVATGGGGVSTITHRPIPRWLRYMIDGSVFQLQLDVNGKVEMATVYAE